MEGIEGVEPLHLRFMAGHGKRRQWFGRSHCAGNRAGSHAASHTEEEPSGGKGERGATPAGRNGGVHRGVLSRAVGWKRG